MLADTAVASIVHAQRLIEVAELLNGATVDISA